MTTRVKLIAIVLLAGGTFSTAPAYSKQVSPMQLMVGDIADAPTGFVELCQRDRGLCLAGFSEQQLRSADVNVTVGAPAASWRVETAAVDPCKPTPTRVKARPIYPRADGSLQAMLLDQVSGADFDDLCGARGRLDALPAIHGQPLLVSPRNKTSALSVREDAAEKELVKRINGLVNRRVRQVPDIISAATAERWDRPGINRDAMGDCEDLAIEKRMLLIEAGFDPSRLFFSVVYKAGFGLHTVLIARTRSGDLVLDSLQPRLLRWEQTRYSWLRVQSTKDPMVWHRVRAPGDPSGMRIAKVAPTPQRPS